MTTIASHTKHSTAVVPGHGLQTQRNFLRENRLLVSQTPMATALRRLELNRKQRQCHYTLPTTVSLARHSGTLPRQVRQSEKQIQTEDIWDEQFLNAALLKCCRRSEGDEPYFSPSNTDNDDDVSTCLRRTASNFELGRVSAACIANKRRPLDSSLPAQLELERKMELGIGSEARQEVVLQLAIPDITDVEQEPQLDHSLSARTNASSNEMLPMQTAAAAAASEEPDVLLQKRKLREMQQVPQVMLTEPQRIELLATTQARQRQLIWEYNRLPLSMGTLRVRRLKVELEQQLDRIDSDLRTLSSPQAYNGHDQLQQISSISC